MEEKKPDEKPVQEVQKVTPEDAGKAKKKGKLFGDPILVID